MILSAAAYAEHLKLPDGKTPAPPPRELEIHFDWETYGTPYFSGGQANQPYALMRRVHAARNVYESIKAWKESKDWGALQAKRPDLWSIVEMVVEMRQAKNA